ncbi:MAG: winged helix-turn-helix domain-containing protein [Candidatus Methanomethylophilaceae archaeon]|jgi:DNA-binding IclR family transcriptional regulator|nr:winged helix-turn-helix domain-containing protein [Candidatus Methanomethylophilaceae archaeon]
MPATRSRNGRMIMEMIQANGRCTTKQICDQLGLTPREAGGVLKTLRLRGLVRIAEKDSHNGHVWGLN